MTDQKMPATIVDVTANIPDPARPGEVFAAQIIVITEDPHRVSDDIGERLAEALAASVTAG